MDCAKSVKVYARNGKCGKEGKESGEPALSAGFGGTRNTGIFIFLHFLKFWQGNIFCIFSIRPKRRAVQNAGKLVKTESSRRVVRHGLCV